MQKNKLENSNILVTGGGGLVGSHIVDLLCKEDCNIMVYDSFIRGRTEHLNNAKKSGKIEIIQADLRDTNKLNQAVKKADYVVHQASAWLRQCQETPRLSLDVTINGTFNLLESCVKNNVKKIVAASSSSVYGEGLYLPTDENHPFNNDLFYGAAKVANEQHYKAFFKKYNLKFVAFRYLNVYGPRQPFQAAYMDVIMHFLNRIDENKSPLVRGDGSSTVDLVFVEDVARANVLALKSDVHNEFFNVCSGEQTTIKKLAEILIELSGKHNLLKPEFVKMDNDLVSKRHGCPKKIKKLLNFVPKFKIEDGLKKVIEWRKLVKKGKK